jgi:hypothetical protein
MSGGSYDYLYTKLEDLDWEAAYNGIRSMESACRVHGKKEAADKLAGWINCYDNFQQMMVARSADIVKLVKDIEWATDDDISWDDIS